MNQTYIDRFNHFISKTKCSISIAEAAGYNVQPTSSWNLTTQRKDANHIGKFVISKEYQALPAGHRSKRVNPLSMMLLGKAPCTHGNRWVQTELMFGLKNGTISSGFAGGLGLSTESWHTAQSLGEHAILGYNLGIYFRNKLKHESTAYFAPIPAGIILDG